VIDKKKLKTGIKSTLKPSYELGMFVFYRL